MKSRVIRVDQDVLRWLRGWPGRSTNDRLRSAAGLPPKVKRKPGPKPHGEECERCGYPVPPRRRGTGFCTQSCAKDQERADRASMDEETALTD